MGGEEADGAAGKMFREEAAREAAKLESPRYRVDPREARVSRSKRRLDMRLRIEQRKRASRDARGLLRRERESSPNWRRMRSGTRRSNYARSKTKENRLAGETG